VSVIHNPKNKTAFEEITPNKWSCKMCAQIIASSAEGSFHNTQNTTHVAFRVTCAVTGTSILVFFGHRVCVAGQDWSGPFPQAVLGVGVETIRTCISEVIPLCNYESGSLLLERNRECKLAVSRNGSLMHLLFFTFGWPLCV